MTHTLTSNQYYGGLNRRFEKRANRLRRLGFEYKRVHVDEYDARDCHAFFVRKRSARSQSVAASTVFHADSRAWKDTLRDLLC